MSDIRFNQWLHQSGTGGVSQSDGGHVGIGTTNPLIPVGAGNTHILNVGVVTCNNIAAGSSITAGTFYGSGANLTGITQTTINNAADNRVLTATGSANVLNAESNVHIDGSGRLMIGTTNEGEANADDLTIATTGHTGITLRSGTSNYGQIFFSDAESGTGEYEGIIAYDHSNNSMVFHTTRAERLRIDSSGRVLIGTTTNRLGEQLHVLGNGIVTSSAENTNMMVFGTFGSSNAIIGSFNSIPLLFRTGNTERLRIGTSGQIGIAGANYGTSGQVLTSQGSGSAVQWATPSSGLSHAQQWYLTTNGNTASSNTDHVLPTDGGTWQKHSAAVGVSAGTLGSDMTYSGSGIFTFPVTGIWKIEFQGWWGIGASDSDHYLRSRIQTTVNNSSWATVQEQANSVKSDSTYTYQGFNVSYLFDVTNTSNCKVRFVLNPSGSNTYYKADGSPPKTGALFMRLGDT